MHTATCKQVQYSCSAPIPEIHLILIPLVTTFNHSQDARFPEGSLPSVISAATANGVINLVLNGCWPGDWPRVAKLASTYPGIILPQFGLHPWWVARRNEGVTIQTSIGCKH